MNGIERLESMGLGIPPSIKQLFEARDDRVAKIDSQRYEQGKRDELAAEENVRFRQQLSDEEERL